MIRACFQTLLILVTVVGLLLPKMSAVIATLVPGVMVVTICTGSEMITLTLDAEGEPVEEVEPVVEHCVMGDVTTQDLTHAPQWVALARSYRCPFIACPNPADQVERLRLQEPSRAPPVLI